MSDFELASRLKIRFEVPRMPGTWAADDLWELPLKAARGPSLYELATMLHNDLKDDVPEFLEDVATPDPKQKLRFEIVKHIIEVKKTEAKAATEAREKTEKRQQIMAIIAQKEVGAMESQSIDELRALLAGL